jgi:plastocyanin
MATPTRSTRSQWLARFVATPVMVAGVVFASAAQPTWAHAGQDHGASALGQAGQTQPGWAQATPWQVTTASPAADLRVGLNKLLAEHVYLAARATGAALAGQTSAFEAAAAALDANSVDLSKAIGAAYGPEAEAAFLPLWRNHIGMVVSYTQGLATDDTAKQQKAVADLLQYAQDFGAFLSAANENLPQPVVAELVKGHIVSLKEIPDAQKARDWDRVYRSLRTAIGHKQLIADPLAQATAAKFPGAFPGDPTTPAVDYRVAVDNLLTEHVFLASSATSAALAGNQAQFQAAAAALDGNSVDVSKGIGLAYGPEAEAAFLPLWRAHIGMVVDYTVGSATKDEPKQQKAVADLLGYTQDFGAFLSAANENLPQAVVADLVKTHVVTLKDVIDVGASGNWGLYFESLRQAAHHMSAIGDPLAAATVAKFPAKFSRMGWAPEPAADADGQFNRVAVQPAAIDQEIRLFTFRPSATGVPVGTTVTWTNHDGAQHTITQREGAFDSGLLGPEQSFSFTFAQPGEYAFYCARHPSMQGVVSVD